MKRLRNQNDAPTTDDGKIVRIDSPSGISKRKFCIGLQIFVLLMQPCVAFAEGAAGAGSVVAGSAAISQAGNTRTIQQFTDRAVINWQDFSIQQGETTRFIQPNSSSVALNRVTGGNPSAILGNLEANGNVFLINPNGIVVGAGARINVNGLVASTLDISNENFMQGGDLNFEGNSRASIINNGEVQALAGDIYLLSSSIENNGILSAENGTVGLAAGQSIQLVDAASPSLVVRATSDSLGGTGIINTGLISAMQAELVANGGNVYGLAINNEGVVRANGSEDRGGRIFLVSDGGKIRSSGDLIAKRGNNGGDVIIHAGGQSGSKIEILGNIDVSGQEYGGTIGMKAAAISLAGATINLEGGIEDGVRLISLGSSSAEITDPTNLGLLDFSKNDNVQDTMSVVDNTDQIQISDDAPLNVKGSIIGTDADGFTDLVIDAADPDKLISFITFELGSATTTPSDGTVSFDVVLKKPSGETELVMLDANLSDLTNNTVAIRATGGDLIEKITLNSDNNGTAFINEIKTGDVELATGTLTVAKNVTKGSNKYKDFEFLITAENGGELPGGSEFVEAFLRHGENEAINLLAEGTYSIQELLPKGWFLDSIDITGGEGTTNLDTATATVDWTSHDNITVTYTNTEGAHITVQKHAEGGENVNFRFAASGTDNRGETFNTEFTLSDGEQNSIGEGGYIRPGTYTVEELETAGWFFDKVVSHGKGGTVTDQGATQVVCVGPGGCIELCYYNSEGAQIIVAKTAIGPAGGETNFEFTATAETPGTDIQPDFSVIGNDSIALNSSEQTGYVRPGTYTISELAKEGWFFDSVDGGTGNPLSAIQEVTVLAGDTRTLTYQNTQGAQITVAKTAIGPAGGETNFEFTATAGTPGTDIQPDFSVLGNDSIVLNSSGKTGYVRPGTYTISELAKEGWFFDKVDGGTGNPLSAIQEVTVLAGDSRTLTYQNTQGVQITVAKTAIGPDGGETNFEFTVSGETADPNFTLTGDDSITLSSKAWDDYIRPGTYTINEDPTNGWFFDSVAFEGTNSKVTNNNGTAQTLEVQPGGEAFLTYQNSQGSEITVTKAAIGVNGSLTDFNFTARGETSDGRFTLSGGESITLSSDGQPGFVRPGEYTIAELETAGWFLQEVTGTSVLNPRSSTQAFSVGAGESFELTFTNAELFNPAIGFRYEPIYPVGVGVGALEYGAPVRTGDAVNGEIAGSSSFNTFSQ